MRVKFDESLKSAARMAIWTLSFSRARMMRHRITFNNGAWFPRQYGRRRQGGVSFADGVAVCERSAF